MMQKTKRDKAKNDNPLMAQFNYDAHDLQDNQQGFISHRQKTKLKWYLFRTTLWIIGGLFLAGLWTYVFGLLAYYAYTDADAGIGFKIFSPLGFLFAGAMFILAIVSLVEIWRSVIHDLRVGKVKQYSGIVTKYERRSKGDGLSLWIIIENTKFNMGYGQHKALDNNKPYYLYTAEKTGRLLSIESASASSQDVVTEKAKHHA